MTVVVVAALAFSSCQRALYPAARAFGSPPEAELAAVRAAFSELKARAGFARLQIAPVLVVDERGATWDDALAGRLVGNLQPHTSLRLSTAAAGAPAVARRPLGRNQLRYLWERTRDYAGWLAAAPPDSDYVLCPELWAREEIVSAVHVFVYTTRGQLVYCRLYNSHQFGPKLDAAGGAAIERFIRTFFTDLQRDPLEIFPKYGVG